MHPVVMLLGLNEVDRVPEPRRLEQVAGIGPQHRHLGQLAAVALEMAMVDGVEPGQGRPQPDVGLGDGVADEVTPGGKPRRQPVQPREQLGIRVLVRGLRAGEPAPVHAVVHVLVDRRGDFLDLLPQPVRVEIGRTWPVVGRPLRLEVQRDLPVVGGHHAAGGNVHDGWHGDAAVVAGHRLLVGFPQPVDAEHRVAPIRVQVETPAAPVMLGPADPHGQCRLKAQQSPDDHCPVRPRASPRHHQPVLPGQNRPAIPSVSCYPPVQVPGIADELASFAHLSDATACP
jgi:hypothetical protein